MSHMTLERSLTIDAPIARVWDVIADLDDYASHAETLTETTVIAGHEEGATRHCVDSSGNDWTETCTAWEPGRRYVIEVDTSTYPAKYRAMFSTFQGTWRVEPVDDGTRVSIRFDAKLRRIPGLTVVMRKLAERNGSDLEAILASYRRAAIGGNGDGGQPARSSP